MKAASGLRQASMALRVSLARGLGSHRRNTLTVSWPGRRVPPRRAAVRAPGGCHASKAVWLFELDRL